MRVVKKTSLRDKKKHARSIRKGVKNTLPYGSIETHKMATISFDGKHYAYPTIGFDKEGKKVDQSFEDAVKAGETYEFDNFKEANKFAHGSFKKGRDRREAMRDYRKQKRKT